MKLSSVLLLMTLLHVSAAELYSQTARLSMHVQQASLPDVLKQIENQSEFLFFYSNEDFDQSAKVNVDASNQRVEEVLNTVLKNTGLVYTIKDRHILLISKKEIMEMAQQGTTVTGTVTDASGEPIPGVNITLKGTLTGTISDINGRYTVNVTGKDAVLVFSFVGYAIQDIPVGDQREINAILEENAREIEEVVVVGYGTQKKVNVIGSISQVTGEKLENRTVPLLSNALAGQMTGVTVIQRSGKPGESPGEIRIRGVGSITDDSAGALGPEALVIVDGVPGSINDVKPEDVASISVLKDAATAAIYGARAANGVILITTKTGKEGKLKVSYNGYAGFTKPTEFPEYANSWEYAAVYNEAVGKATYDVDAYKNSTNRDLYPNSNFLKDVFSRNGIQTGHDISLNGGSRSTQYYLTFGYLNQNGIVEKNKYTRYNMRLSLVTNLASRLKLSTWLSGNSSKIEEPAIPGSMATSRLGGIISNAVRWPSIFAGRMSNGDYGLGPEQIGVPAAWIDSPSFYEAPTFKVTGRLRLDYNPVDGLQLSAVGGLNHTDTENKHFRSTMRLNDQKTLSPSFLEQKEMKTVYQTVQLLAEYDKIFVQKHDLNILAGYSFEEQRYTDVTASRDNFPTNDLPYMNVGSADNQKSAGGGNEWAIQSVFGRFKYGYAHKYLAETTVRYDGSSRFPESHKYAFFPSVAVGWRISEEGFFKDNISWINNLKLKASWGKLGNQNITNYPFQNTYALNTYVMGNAVKQGGYISSLKDPALHWEETRTTDGGVEMSLFGGGLLDISAGYFYRKTIDCLYKPSANVSKVLGMSVDYANTGSLKNTGWEFEFSHRNKTGGFSYHIGGNLTVTKNELLSLGLGNVTQKNGLVGAISDGSNALIIGRPMQAYYGYKTDGMFLDQADIDDYPNQSRVASEQARPGDLRYVNIMNGEGETKPQVEPDYDQVYLGSRIPKYTYSVNLGAEYMGFDLSAQFYGVAGVKGRLDTYAGYALYAEGNVQRWQMDGRWNPANPQRYNDYPRMSLIQNTGGRNAQISDFWIINASYLRLKNLQLGYTIPKTLTDRIGISSLRIYANMENVFCINSYRKGWDPEINTGGDYYPILSTYTFGVNLRF